MGGTNAIWKWGGTTLYVLVFFVHTQNKRPWESRDSAKQNHWSHRTGWDMGMGRVIGTPKTWDVRQYFK